MQRYFLPDEYEEKETFQLTGDDFHHAKNVMRMSIDDQCFLAFSNQVVIVAQIIRLNDESIDLIEVSKEHQLKEMPVNVTIACGYTKGDKLELVAQKATELGMHGLIGFPSKTSVVKWDEKKRQKKSERLQKIVKEASEQCHRQIVPSIELLDSFTTLTDKIKDYTHCLVAYEESSKQGEKSQFVKTISACQPGDSLLIIFGPEGGITPEEITRLNEKNALSCALGPRILRAETAPFYALSAMSYQWELHEK